MSSSALLKGIDMNDNNSLLDRGGQRDWYK